MALVLAVVAADEQHHARGVVVAVVADVGRLAAGDGIGVQCVLEAVRRGVGPPGDPSAGRGPGTHIGSAAGVAETGGVCDAVHRGSAEPDAVAPVEHVIPQALNVPCRYCTLP